MKEEPGNESEDNKKIKHTMVVLGLLCGLHGLSDLHADDVNLCLAVLQHLFRCLEKLLVLWRDKTKQETRERAKQH